MPGDPRLNIGLIFRDLAKRGRQASAAAQAARPNDQPKGRLTATYWAMSPAVDVEIINAEELFAGGSCPACSVGIGKRTTTRMRVRYTDPIGRRCQGVIARLAEWPKGPTIQLFSVRFLDFLGFSKRRAFGWRPVEIVNRGKVSQQLFEMIRSRVHVGAVSLRGGNPDFGLECETCGRRDLPTYPLAGQLPTWLNPSGSLDRADQPELFVSAQALRTPVPAWFTVGDWMRGVHLVARKRPWEGRRPAEGTGIGLALVGRVARHLIMSSESTHAPRRRRLTSA